MSLKNIVLPVLIAGALAGCADQMLGSDRARDSISGSLGLPAADVTIVERRADGPTDRHGAAAAKFAQGGP